MSTSAENNESIPEDINNIPYDAPISVQVDPKWCSKKSFEGTWWSTLTIKDVPHKDLTGQWVLVSGGNNGIGREAALGFADMGANVLLACRQPPSHEIHPEAVVAECQSRARAAGHLKSQFEWFEVNYADLASVEAFAQRWLDTGRPLSILCNNAGMGSAPAPLPFKTKDGFEIIHQVNFLAHVLLTLRLLPSLAKAEAPRIVCTTSCYHYAGKYDLDGWNDRVTDGNRASVRYYKNNKLNFQIWLTEFQHRVLQHDQYKKITIQGFHPGYVNSGIWTLANNEYWLAWIIQSLLQLMAFLMAITPKQGSMAMLYVATAPECGPDPATQGVGELGGKGGGRYFNRIWESEPMPHTKDRDCRMRVWRKVNDELKLQEKGLLDVLGLYAKDA